MPDERPPVVFLVDDEPQLRELTQIFMERQLGSGYELVQAEHGGQAVGLFEEFKQGGREVSGILMDVRMPVMDGIEATAKILEIDPAALIFIVTAFAEDNLVNQALAAGAAHVYNKSLGIAAIAERVANQLRKGAPKDGVPAHALERGG